ncbi:hypothetical protein DICVIV_03380 [Dictyocaulus viviparus]|uniref:Uncharacterized protein n=1 Tax=Dictyocaulus viviparus TaxID=29172 RepID=A0A0D8Y185_DICVI|nr:hypothetical protein DICVIV_03380 [Dictyocaulus viviparus]
MVGTNPVIDFVSLRRSFILLKKSNQMVGTNPVIDNSAENISDPVKGKGMDDNEIVLDLEANHVYDTSTVEHEIEQATECERVKDADRTSIEVTAGLYNPNNQNNDEANNVSVHVENNAEEIHTNKSEAEQLVLDKQNTKSINTTKKADEMKTASYQMVCDRGTQYIGRRAQQESREIKEELSLHRRLIETASRNRCKCEAIRDDPKLKTKVCTLL